MIVCLLFKVNVFLHGDRDPSALWSIPPTSWPIVRQSQAWYWQRFCFRLCRRTDDTVRRGFLLSGRVSTVLPARRSVDVVYEEH